jgi:hypothetical protein
MADEVMTVRNCLTMEMPMTVGKTPILRVLPTD